MVKPFDQVLSGSDQRFLATASKFGKPTPLRAFNGWARGEMEGKPADKVKAQLSDLILNPDKRPAGLSPISGKPGQTFNESKIPLLTEVNEVEKNLKPDERVLLVMSGGGLDLVSAWDKAGKPQDFKFDHSEMAKRPYCSATGKLFKQGAKGLEEVANNSASGVYLMEHAVSAFNPPKNKSKVA